MFLKYYLDTNAVQSLGARLCDIPSKDGVYTSVLSIMELVKSMEDEDSFRRKRGSLLHLKHSRLLLDLLPTPYILQGAFKINYWIPPFYYSFNRIVDTALVTDSYKVFLDTLQKNELVETFEDLKMIFKKSNEKFKDSLTQYNEKGNKKDNKLIFVERWKDKEKKDLRLYESINHYAVKQSKYSNQSVVILLKNYDHSLDNFMLISYYYDEKKNFSGDLPAKNDGFDLQHLLYLRDGCKLVTDDDTFKAYVNDVVDGLAIGTEEFLDEIKINKENQMKMNNDLLLYPLASIKSNGIFGFELGDKKDVLFSKIRKLGLLSEIEIKKRLDSLDFQDETKSYSEIFNVDVDTFEGVYRIIFSLNRRNELNEIQVAFRPLTDYQEFTCLKDKISSCLNKNSTNSLINMYLWRCNNCNIVLSYLSEFDPNNEPLLSFSYD